MYLIVGLGNPGEEYVGTRHNVGFRVLDTIQNSKLKAQSEIKFSDFQINKPLQAEISKGLFGEMPIVLVKPTTYMNNSGITVKKLVTDYQIPVTDSLIVIHDDITIDLGRVKISKGSGAGKHNGVQSIIDHLKTKDFIRVRIGVGRGEGDIKDVVLSKFTMSEQDMVNVVVDKTIHACVDIILSGLSVAMSVYNK